MTTARDRLKLATTLLVSTSAPDFVDRAEEWDSDAWGRLVTPRNTGRVEETAALDFPWAADNDGFQGVTVPRFKAMVERIAGLPGLLWVTAPDEVADARATAKRFDQWVGYLHDMRVPVALVAQDGLETRWGQRWLAERWEMFDCLFVGGSDDFKLGPGARTVCQLAREHGKLIHLGRVNSLERLAYGRLVLGADTQDGTNWATNKRKATGRFGLPRLKWGLNWIEAMELPSVREEAWRLALRQWRGEREEAATQLTLV